MLTSTNPWPAPNTPVNIHLPHVILCSWSVSLEPHQPNPAWQEESPSHRQRRRQFPPAPYAKGSNCQSASQNKKLRSVRQDTYPKYLQGPPCQRCVENSLLPTKHSFIGIMHFSAVFTALAFMLMSRTWENDTKRDNITQNFGSCISLVTCGNS